MPDTAVQFELSYKPTKDRNKDAKVKFQRFRLVQTFRVHADQEGCTIAAVSTGKGGVVLHEAKFVTGGSYSILAAGGESMLKNLIFRGLKKNGKGWRAAFRDTNADKDMFISMEWQAVAIRMLGALWNMMPDEKLPHEDVVRELIKARQIIETKEKPLCETRLPAVIFALNAKVPPGSPVQPPPTAFNINMYLEHVVTPITYNDRQGLFLERRAQPLQPKTSSPDFHVAKAAIAPHIKQEEQDLTVNQQI